MRYLQASIISEPEDTPDITDVTFVVTPTDARHGALPRLRIVRPLRAETVQGDGAGALSRRGRGRPRQHRDQPLGARARQGGRQPRPDREPGVPRQGATRAGATRSIPTRCGTSAARTRRSRTCARAWCRSSGCCSSSAPTARRREGVEGGARGDEDRRCATCSRSRRTRASRRRRCSSCSTRRSA